MSDLFFKLQDELEPVLRAGELEECDSHIAQTLRGLPVSPFHQVLDLQFTNPPKEVAAQFDAFFRKEQKRFSIQAAYTETNGFDINTDCWYFDFFAYKAYGGTTDFAWICDWQSTSWPDMALTGMETLQDVYASDAFGEESFDEASNLCSLLVVSRFQLLIAKSAPLMRELHFPLLATGHDFNYIAEVLPKK